MLISSPEILTSNSAGDEHAEKRPEEDRTPKGERDESSKVGNGGAPVRQVAVDAVLGVDDGDPGTAAANLDEGGGQRREDQKRGLKRDERKHKVLRVAEPDASLGKDLVALLLGTAVRLLGLVLDALDSSVGVGLDFVHLRVDLVANRANAVRDAVDELVDRLACLGAALLDGRAKLLGGSRGRGDRSGEQAAGSTLRVLAGRAQAVGRVGHVRVTERDGQRISIVEFGSRVLDKNLRVDAAGASGPLAPLLEIEAVDQALVGVGGGVLVLVADEVVA